MLTPAQDFGYHARAMRHSFSVVLVGSIVLLGCGSDDKHGGLPDGPLAPSDGSVDGPVDAPIDTPDQPVPVALTVLRNGTLQAGVHTYFLNADGSVVATLDTDASGTVTAVMAAGGSVTAINPFPPIQTPAAVALADNELRTFMGVKPGDHLVLTRNDKLDVTFLAPVDNGAIEYDLHTTCGGGELPANGGSGSGSPGGTVRLSACNGTADILVIAKAPNEGPPITIGALYHPNQEIKDGVLVDLSADGYDQPRDDVMFSYTNAPNATLTVSHALVSARGAFAPFVANASGGTATINEPTIAGTTSVVDIQVDLNDQHHVVDWGPFAATYALDMTGLLLPGFVGNQPAYDPTTRRVSWTEETTGGAPDMTMTRIDVFGAARTWHWTVAAPYTAGELQFPTLPTDIADWTPVAGTDDVQLVDVTNVKFPGGYDAARAHIHDVRDAIADRGFTGIAIGATGRAVAVQFVSPRVLVRAPTRRSRVVPAR